MELEFKDLLAEYKDELTHFQSDDILVNIQPNKVLSPEEIHDLEQTKTQRILKVAQASYREIGVHPFCQSFGVVQWEKQEKTMSRTNQFFTLFLIIGIMIKTHSSRNHPRIIKQI